MTKIEVKYFPFYECDENVYNPGKGHSENSAGARVGSRQPHYRGEKDRKVCDILQNTQKAQDMFGGKP